MEVITGIRYVYPECGEDIEILEIKTGEIVSDIISGGILLRKESDWHNPHYQMMTDKEFASKGYFE